MFTDLINTTAKAAAGTAAGIAGLIATASTIEVSEPQMKFFLEGLERLGSFFLVAVFVAVVLFAFVRTVPKVLQMFIDRDKQFIDALRLEREANERSTANMASALRDHTDKIANKLDNQTNHIDQHFQDQTTVLKNIKGIAHDFVEQEASQS